MHHAWWQIIEGCKGPQNVANVLQGQILQESRFLQNVDTVDSQCQKGVSLSVAVPLGSRSHLAFKISLKR